MVYYRNRGCHHFCCILRHSPHCDYRTHRDEQLCRTACTRARDSRRNRHLYIHVMHAYRRFILLYRLLYFETTPHDIKQNKTIVHNCAVIDRFLADRTG